MAYSGTLQNLYSSSTSLNWDLHNLGVFNPDMSSVMEATAPFFPQADFSTGYLQDALLEWNDRCKRRRLDFYDHGHDQRTCLDNVVQNYWNSNWIQDPLENFTCLNKITEANRVSDESLNSSISSISEGETIFSEIKTLEESVSAPETNNSPHKDPLAGRFMHEKKTQISRDPGSSSDEGGFKRNKKKVITGVVYPFALVKPGGVDGDMTLNDINERILMPPTRPVRHPVGDFAGRPFVSPDGPGLSGKAVVALTKIHTQGRGTITIIRTRG